MKDIKLKIATGFVFTSRVRCTSRQCAHAIIFAQHYNNARVALYEYCAVRIIYMLTLKYLFKNPANQLLFWTKKYGNRDFS